MILGIFSSKNAKKKVRQTYVDAKFYGESLFDGFRTIRIRLDVEKFKNHQFSALPSKLDNFESPSTADPTVVLLTLESQAEGGSLSGVVLSELK